jgi:DNA-binding transcriptional MerR regulator
MQNVLALHQEQSVQLHKFIQLVKDNNMTLGKIATEAADQLAEPPVDYRKQDKQAEQMLEQIQTLRTEVEQSSKKQSAIMEEMENVGTCYMEQQDSTAKMEEAIADMKRILSDIDYTKEQ